LRRPGFVASFAFAVFLGMILLYENQLPADPVYHGRKLSRWLQTYASSSRGSPGWQEVDEAVRNIGTNSVPLLLQLFRARDSSLKLKLVALAGRQRIIEFHFITAEMRHREASMAFIALGDIAKDSVPELIKIFYSPDSSIQSRCAVEDALGWIGPNACPALPLLLQTTTNFNATLRANALWALGEMKVEPQLCVPALVQALQDTNEWVQTSAVHALGMFGTNSQTAIPSLTKLANSAPRFGAGGLVGIQLQFEARKALKNINRVSPSEESLPNFLLPIADPLNPPR